MCLENESDAFHVMIPSDRDASLDKESQNTYIYTHIRFSSVSNLQQPCYPCKVVGVFFFFSPCGRNALQETCVWGWGDSLTTLKGSLRADEVRASALAEEEEGPARRRARHF